MNNIPIASGIYKIVCKVTGEIYVGSSVNLRKRWGQHYSSLRKGNHVNPILQNAWNKYGEEAFCFVIMELIDKEMLLQREQEILDELKPFAPDNGFNVCRSAQSFRLGLKHSPEAIKKMSEASKRRIHPLLGKHHSEEAKKNMSRAKKGKKQSEEAKKKLSEVRKNSPAVQENVRKMHARNKGAKRTEEQCERISKSQEKYMKELIITSPEGIEHHVVGIRKFCKEHQLSQPSIMKVANGECTHHKGWKARYPDQTPNDVIKNIQERREKNMKMIHIISPAGEEYFVKDLVKFCKEHDLHYSTMCQVAKGRRSYYRLWKARYIQDEAS